MKDLKGQAQAIRTATQAAVRYLPDAVAYEAPRALYDLWSGQGVRYVRGDIRRHTDGELYRCLLDHVSQPDWAPGVAPSLWVKIDDPSEAWPPWRRPTYAEEAYAVGAQVSHGGKRWINGRSANVAEPGSPDSGWKEAV